MLSSRDFQNLQEVLPGDPGHPRRLLEVAAELPLQDPVDPPCLLLFPKLETVGSDPDAPVPPVLARSVRTTLNGTLVGVAPISLEEELLTLPAGKAGIPDR